MRENNLAYTGDEYKMRLGIFSSVQRQIKEHNSKPSSFKLGLSHLSCLTPAEYKSILGSRKDTRTERHTKPTRVTYPDSFDWRNQGVVNPIKDQAQCGSCWAFSAIQTIETAWAIAHGTLYSLSESNIVDCCTSCYGCDGGWHYAAIDYIVNNQNGGVNSEADYPYHDYDEDCMFDPSKTYTQVTGYIDIASGNEDDLADKVSSIGAAAISIDASQASFHYYTSGIYDEPACSSSWLDHAVGCVGYGSEGSTKYWIVRNSWGTDWGENGYVRMIWKNNQCGVATSAVIATVA
jgi:cathepsin L